VPTSAYQKPHPSATACRLTVGPVSELLAIEISPIHHTIRIDTVPDSIGGAFTCGTAGSSASAFFFLHPIGKRLTAVDTGLE
jgi:hypothetical protein